MPLLAVDAQGSVDPAALASYKAIRIEEVAKRLEVALQSGCAKTWYDGLSEKDLYEIVGDETKYLGEESGEAQTVAAVQKAKATDDLKDIVAAVEDVILNFCGFQSMKTKYIANALHFQFAMDIERILGAAPTALVDAKAPSEADKALFDEAELMSAELLLRVIVETDDGGLLAYPFSPGQPMGKLLKLPLFAQLVMVLTNAVEALWYQQELPHCPMAINVYASLLVDGAPVQQMVEGVQQVEIMEMTKGAKRGPEVVHWVKTIRETGSEVLLDDFDTLHPGIDSEPDGIKVSVFANAFHSLQVFNDKCVPAEMLFVDKEKTNDRDFKDYYCSLLPKTQPKIKMVVLEGSENCLKSEKTPGPPLNFGQPSATIASAHLCQVIAKALRALNPEIKICRQGGRALYEDEDFDEEASAIILKSGKNLSAARTGDAGTVAWTGQEGVRRAAMRVRPLVFGVKKRCSSSR